jgi:hypothetical protein
VRAHSVEHKLGIHASPTCTMVYGDKGGATGFLIGEEHNGMACMFTMMNRARLAVGLQGVAIAETATQQAMSYARERKQGAASAIIAYPDVKRMLLTMRALTGAARAICYATGVAHDRALRGKTEAARKIAHERAALLTPVAKAFSTESASRWPLRRAGTWRHGLYRRNGGRPAFPRRPHRRDLRRHQRHPGDRSGDAQGSARGRPHGGALSRRVAGHGVGGKSQQCACVRRDGDAARRAVDSLARATNGCWRRNPPTPRSPAPRLICACSARRRWHAGRAALTALRQGDGAARTALARFFAENIAVQASGLERTVTEGADSVTDAEAALAE